MCSISVALILLRPLARLHTTSWLIVCASDEHGTGRHLNVNGGKSAGTRHFLGNIGIPGVVNRYACLMRRPRKPICSRYLFV